MGKGTEILGRIINFFLNEGGEEYQIAGNFIHPCLLYHCSFAFSFPMDLDVRAKATLLGACFLIDYMFFEKKANTEGDGFGV